MTHVEYSEKVLGKDPMVPCSAHTMTFGSVCLNCGWDPRLFDHSTKKRAAPFCGAMVDGKPVAFSQKATEEG